MDCIIRKDACDDGGAEIDNTALAEAIAEALEGITIDNTAVVEALNELLEALNAQPQIEGLNLIQYCDESGSITGFATLTLNEETNELVPYYFDAAMQPTAEAPTGVPCGDSVGSQLMIVGTVCYDDGA